MDIQGIDHVEFNVGDAQQAAFYLCTAFGFRVCGQAGPETGLKEHRSLLLRQGGIQLLLTSALTPRTSVADHVSRHGDGVANIAFGTTDARKAFNEAVQRGAAPITPPAEYTLGDARVVVAEIAGFGDVTHRFVERHGLAATPATEGGVAPQEFMPKTMDMFAPDPEDAGELLSLVDHAAICLPAGELDPTVRFYEEVFGFRQIFEEHIEVGEQAMNSKVVQSPSEQVTFTLIEPDATRRPGQIDDFLARHGGAGVQHLAFLTDDIVTTVHTLEGQGVRFLRTPGSYYDALEERFGRTDLETAALRSSNVLVDRDHWGEVFQIFTQSMHVRHTYFMEVIDRHGARTFGSGNIKALYAAVEREQATAAPS
ncbi:4-hydroxyphenylpyruvate dioxygenase [Streptomyces sp. NPDC003011]